MGITLPYYSTDFAYALHMSQILDSPVAEIELGNYTTHQLEIQFKITFSHTNLAKAKKLRHNINHHLFKEWN